MTGKRARRQSGPPITNYLRVSTNAKQPVDIHGTSATSTSSATPSMSDTIGVSGKSNDLVLPGELRAIIMQLVVQEAAYALTTGNVHVGPFKVMALGAHPGHLFCNKVWYDTLIDQYYEQTVFHAPVWVGMPPSYWKDGDKQELARRLLPKVHTRGAMDPSKLSSVAGFVLAVEGIAEPYLEPLGQLMYAFAQLPILQDAQDVVAGSPELSSVVKASRGELNFKSLEFLKDGAGVQHPFVHVRGPVVSEESFATITRGAVAFVYRMLATSKRQEYRKFNFARCRLEVFKLILNDAATRSNGFGGHCLRIWNMLDHPGMSAPNGVVNIYSQLLDVQEAGRIGLVRRL